MSVRRAVRVVVVICVLVCLCAPSPRAEDWLPVSPEDLTMTQDPLAPGAPAIYLYRQVERDDQSNVEKDYIRIKILTEEGRKYGDIEILYFPDQGNIGGVKARTIQPDGAIANFDGKIYDKTVVKARGLRYNAKTFTLPDVRVGTIVEYRYTMDENPDYVYFSHWDLNSDLFTRQGKFSVKLNTNFTSRCIGQRLPPGVTLPKASSSHVVALQVSNVPAFKSEEFMPPEDAFKSRVEFQYTESEETDSDKFWKNIGKTLGKRADDFTHKRKGIEQAVAETISPSDTPEAKLRKLYLKVLTVHNRDLDPEKTEQEQKREKVKNATNAEEILKAGSGTGGDLTWLYLALVRDAGFEAYPVFVSTRDTYFFDPRLMNERLLNQNIVLVRLNGKDLYFDPGSAFIPFGMLPWSETDVKGLSAGKEGINWITTPLPSSALSRILRVARLQLTPEGALEGHLSITFTGLEAARCRRDERKADAADRKTYIEGLVQEYVPAGIQVELSNQPDWTSSSDQFVAEFNLKIPGWASRAGRRILMPQGVFSGSEKHLFEHADRTYPVYFAFPYQTVDDVTIDLPPGWQISSLPPGSGIDRQLCGFHSSAEQKGNSIHLSRTLALNGIYLPPDYYSSLRNFFQALRSGDEQQIIVSPPAPSR